MAQIIPYFFRLTSRSSAAVVETAHHGGSVDAIRVASPATARAADLVEERVVVLERETATSRIDSFERLSSMICPCPLWKRAMDLFGASLALVIMLPTLLIVAAIVRCGSRGPVFFRQKRYGLQGRPFHVWKFRTIKIGEAQDQHQSYVLDLMASDRPFEKRDRKLDLIPCGRILRKLGFDEFPQLINVLKGEMSLVGPRPDVVPPEKYKAWQQDRFEVLPGITGLWQVSGKNRTTFETMIQLDIAYIQRRSVWLDLSIILRTVPAILWV